MCCDGCSPMGSQAREGASVALVGLGADAAKKILQAIASANKFLAEDNLTLTGVCAPIDC